MGWWLGLTPATLEFWVVKVPGSSRVPAPPWVGSRSPDGWDQIKNAAGRRKESGAATPTQRVAGSLYLSILPAGTRDTLTETRTHGFGLIDICGIQQNFGGRG